MKADELLKLLAAKHADDVFVPECKTGPSQAHNHLRLDAWAMAKSWANPAVYGYEIKVSRSDWLADRKWHNYLKYCNCFSIVTAHGVVIDSEIPDGIGLMIAAKTGRTLVTKRKAAFREVVIPEELLRYILMCRCTISRTEFVKKDRLEYWRQWLDDCKIGADIGYRVSRRIRQHIEDADKRVADAERKIERYAQIEQRLTELGFDISRSVTTWEFADRINTLTNGIPKNFRYTLTNALTGLNATISQLDEIEKMRMTPTTNNGGEGP